MQLINDILDHYAKAIDNGFGLLTPDVNWLLNTLIVLNIAVSATAWALSDDQVVVKFARKIVYVGMIVWIVQNWATLTTTLANSFMFLGMKAGGVGFPRDYVLNPGNIALRGFTASEPIMQQISDLSGPVSFFENFIQIILLSLAVASILIAFFVVAIQAIVAMLTFKFGSLAAFVLIPFSVLKPTSFIAERPLGWVVAAGVRLMVLTLVAGLGDAIFGQMQIPPDSVTVRKALEVALSAIVLMVLSIVATRVAGDLVTGGPSLGAGDAVGAAGGAGSVIYGGAQYGYGAGRGVASALSSTGLMAVRAAAAVKSGGMTVAAGAASAASGLSSSAGSAAKVTSAGGPSAGSPSVGRLPTAPQAGTGSGGSLVSDSNQPPTASSPGGNARTKGASRVRDGARRASGSGGGGGGLAAGGSEEE